MNRDVTVRNLTGRPKSRPDTRKKNSPVNSAENVRTNHYKPVPCYKLMYQSAPL